MRRDGCCKRGGRVYLVGGEAAVALGAIVGLIWTAVRGLRGRGWRRSALEGSLFLYVGALAAVTLFPVAVGFGSGDVSLNLVPMRSLLGIASIGAAQMSRQIVGNVVLFVPLGLLAPALSPRLRSARGVALLGLSVSLAVETAQFIQATVGFARLRAVDVDDVLLNVLGALVGYGLWMGARALTNKRIEQNAIQVD